MTQLTKIALLFALSLFSSTVNCKFPKGFKFGTSTAAFQVEGAWLQDGKSLSAWDNLAHLPGFTSDGLAPDVGADSYNRYPEDIALMKSAGIKHYRMSIAWTRILPAARDGSPVNAVAVEHYREMLKAFIDAGITPYVTLIHGDLPMLMYLHGYGHADKYFVNDFRYYADVCFQRFGDLVKNWFTFNEPWCIAVFEGCKPEECSTMPYLVAHNVLLAHAAAVKLYRQKYAPSQGGKVGIVLNTDMFYPKDATNAKDKEAAERALAFYLGWFAEPIFSGDYPAVMKTKLGKRLPQFTEEQKAMLKGSADFFALNHYSSVVCEDGRAKEGNNYWNDMNVSMSNRKEWKLTDMGWAIVPEGIHDILVEIYKRYTRATGVPIYVTENGMANKETTREAGINDTPRIEYYQAYLKNVERAANEDGVNVQGYFAWSLLDNFEWGAGFTKRFGLVRVEVGEVPVRIPKKSLIWYRDFIAQNQ